jgi:hypothetical protein
MVHILLSGIKVYYYIIIIIKEYLQDIKNIKY